MLRRSAVWLALAVACTAPRTASADEMDVTLERLAIDPSTGGACSADGITTTGPCAPDDASFQRLMQQLGTAVAPPGLSPARTLGYRHFYVGLETGITSIHGLGGGTPNPDDPEWRAENYFRLGTEGPSDTTYRNGNRFPTSALSWIRLTLRKGLPFGLELGGSAGRLMQTSLWLFSFELKWSLLEGFRRRWPAFLPDFAVRAATTSVTGGRGFTLTVPTVDATLSKGFVLGDTLTLTPYVAGQIQWVLADSGVIDVTPGERTNNISGTDLVVFESVRAWHPRILAGMQMQVHRFVVNGAFRYDLRNPAANLDAVSEVMPKQWTIDVGVGVIY